MQALVRHGAERKTDSSREICLNLLNMLAQNFEKKFRLAHLLWSFILSRARGAGLALACARGFSVLRRCDLLHPDRGWDSSGIRLIVGLSVSVPVAMTALLLDAAQAATLLLLNKH
jgi:hypothetical protein